MLTKNDLQQIRNIFHNELDTAIEQQIRPIIREEAQSVVREETRSIVQGEIHTALKPIKQKLNRIAKDVSYMIKTFDTRITQNAREIQKVKQHIGMDVN